MVDLTIAQPGGAFLGGFNTGLQLMNAKRGGDVAFREASRADLFNNYLMANPDVFTTGQVGPEAYRVNPLAADKLQGQFDTRRRENRRSSLLNDKTKLEIDRIRSQMTEEQTAAEAAAMRRGVQRAQLFGPEQWNAAADELGIGDFKVDPNVPPEDFEEYKLQVLETLLETADYLERVDARNAPPTPLSSPGKVQFDIDRNLLPADTPLSTSQVTVNTGPTGIDYGNPEKGLVWARNEDGTIRLDERGAPVAIPYQGGSVFSDQQAAEEAQGAVERRQETTASIVTDEANRIRNAISGEYKLPFDVSTTTGLVGSLLSSVPGSEAHNVGLRLETIRSNIGFDKLQSMRKESPTGGAVGQVSNFENRLMQAVYGSLAQSQNDEELLYNLGRVEEIYTRIIHEGIPDDEASAMLQQINQEQDGRVDNALPPSFVNNPTIIQSAESGGVTLQEIWNNLTPEARERLSK